MKPIKKIKSFTVKRSRWARGEGMGSLLNEQKKSCCLGFACLAAGISVKDIAGQSMPDSIGVRIPLLTELYKHSETKKHLVTTRLSDKAAEINDDQEISDRVRERKLKSLFKQHDVEIGFVP